MKSEILLDAGSTRNKPIVIKTEQVTMQNYLFRHQQAKSNTKGSNGYEKIVSITLPRIDALKGGA